MAIDRYYPVFLDINDAACLVVGGGKIAERKVTSLRDCGARVSVVSPECTDGLRYMAEQGVVAWHRRRYSAVHMQGMRLVIAATSDRAVNTQVYEDARALGIPVNTVDVPDLCSFIVPAVYRQGDIRIAVSTGGGAPGVSARIRDRAGAVIGAEWGALVAALKRNRDRIRSLPDDNKTAFWKHVRSFAVEDYVGRADELPALVGTWVAAHEACAAGHLPEQETT